MYWLGCGLDELRFNSQLSKILFPFSKVSRLALGPTWPPIHWVPGAVSQVVNWLWCAGNFWALCIAKVKNEWNYSSVLLICFQDVGRENFTLFSAPSLLVCYTKKKHLHHVQGRIYYEANEAWASGPPTCMRSFQVPVNDPRNALKMPKILELIYEGNLIEVFQSFPIVLKIYMTLPITKCETETFLNHQ